MPENEIEHKLHETVVETGTCAGCGTCAAVCPCDIIEMEGDEPKITDECDRAGTGNCFNACPRTSTGAYHLGLRLAGRDYDPRTGGYRETLGAVASDKELREAGQDGGAVMALAKYALEKGLVDAVVGVTAGSAWKPSVVIIEDPEDVTEMAGSKYSRVGLVEALAEAAEKGIKKVLVIGLPCQINGLAKIKNYEIPAKGARLLRNMEETTAAKLPEIYATIGLFCTENFDYEKLRELLEEKGVNIEEVEKFDVKKGKFVAIVDGEEKSWDVKEFHDAVPDGCEVCHDFIARLADVSAGSVGTPDGVTTLIIRSDRGEELVKGAIEEGYLEERGDVDFSEVERLIDFKIRKARETWEERLEETDMPAFWIGDYGGMVARADGTYAVRVKVGPAGWLEDAEALRVVARVMEEGYRIKFTDRQQFEIHGIPAHKVPEVVETLEEVGLRSGSEGPLVRTILACPGAGNCSSGNLETEKWAEVLEEELGEEPTPYKFKISLAGCPNACVRPQHNDLGFVGVRKPAVDVDECTGCGQCADVCKVDAIRMVTACGEVTASETDFKRCIMCGKCIDVCPHDARYAEEEGVLVYLGGKGGRDPREARKVEIMFSEEDIPRICKAVIEKYRELAEEPQKERLAHTIEKHGMGPFVEAILEATREREA